MATREEKIVLQDDETLVKFIFKTEELPDIIAGHCQDRGYQAMVDNPDFDDTKEESDENPRQIQNPVSAKEFVWNVVREFGVAPAKRIRKQRAMTEALKDLEISDINVNGLDNDNDNG